MDEHVKAYWAYLTALAITFVNARDKCTRETKRSERYYEEGHRLHQAQLLKR